MGSDSLEELHTWKDPDIISSMSRMVAGYRPGHSGETVDERYREMVELFPIPAVHVYSSDLRRRFADGLNTRYLLPDRVRDYIRENDLYATGKGRR